MTTTIHDVRAYGAVGDGSHDDTAAFQRAIDSLPPSGGRVFVPHGSYLIDPVKSVRLASNTVMELADTAILCAKPNSVERTYVLLVEEAENVEINGGAIQGEREQHTYAGQGTHEWGMGIAVYASKKVKIKNVRVSDCTGDGITVGRASEDVEIDNVNITRARRNGLTIGRVLRCRVTESTITHTNGTAPQAGIDIEPDSAGTALCEDVVIERCRITDNTSAGIVTYTAVASTIIRRVKIVDCELARNSRGLNAIRAQDLDVRYCLIHHNRDYGAYLTSGTTAHVADNIFEQNKGGAARAAEVRQFGMVTATNRDVQKSNEAGQINVGLNFFR
jgi:nitrous oxidase accessory protein NosD